MTGLRTLAVLAVLSLVPLGVALSKDPSSPIVGGTVAPATSQHEEHVGTPIPGSPMAMKVRGAEDIIGWTIRSSKGEKLGTLDDVVIRIDDGRIAYCVVSFGGRFLGMGKKLVGVPWDLLRPDPKEHAFILNATRGDLARAPALEKGKLPSVAPPLPGVRTESRSAESVGSKASEYLPSTGGSAATHTSMRLDNPTAPPAVAKTGPSPAAPPATSVTEKSGEKGAPVLGDSLPLKLANGIRFDFVARTSYSHGTESLTHAATPASALMPETRSDCRLLVKDVGSNGESSLLLTIERGKEPKESAPAVGATAGSLIELGRDGRLVKGADKSSPIPADLVADFQWIFACGLHSERFEVGRVYSLASLYSGEGSSMTGASGMAHEILLRFDGVKKDARGVELARFGILAPSREAVGAGVAPKGGASRSESKLEGSLPAAVGSLPKVGSEAGDWPTIGEAAYRTEDGILETLHCRGFVNPAAMHGGAAEATRVLKIERVSSTG